jgi:hypothetical protein
MDETTARVITICNTLGAPPEVYHRDFPEIRCQGETIEQAAVGLSRALERALDSALTIWRQECLQQAVAEVHAFADQRARERADNLTVLPMNR